MSLLITEPEVGAAQVSERDWTMHPLPCEARWPCAPCAGHSLIAFACAQEKQCMVMNRHDLGVVSTMPALSGLSGMCLSPCERYLYQLSAEADCVHTLLTATGELMYAAPVGVFPRMMQLDETGGYLLAAGGAAAEAYLLKAPELICERIIHTPSPCFGAAFWQDGLVLVCAPEGDAIQTAVYTLENGKCKARKKAELSGQMGGLCVCPDGRHMLLSTMDGLMKMSLDTGALLWNRPEWPLCMKLYCRGRWALVSDTLCGKACLMDHHQPWKQRVMGCGFGAEACFVP